MELVMDMYARVHVSLLVLLLLLGTHFSPATATCDLTSKPHYIMAVIGMGGLILAGAQILGRLCSASRWGSIGKGCVLLHGKLLIDN